MNPLVARWDVVSQAQQAVRYGGASLRHVPGLLKRVIKEDLWHEYVVPTGEVVHFSTFTEFVTASWGLDTTVAMVQHICHDDLEALDVLDQVLTPKPGRKKQKRGCQPHQGTDNQESEDLFGTQDTQYDEITNSDNVTICSQRSNYRGNSRDYALRRLRHPTKGRPDIHARVLAGELSPRQGLIEAGFVHPPTPLAIVRATWKKLSYEDRCTFLREVCTAEEWRQYMNESFKEEQR